MPSSLIPHPVEQRVLCTFLSGGQIIAGSARPDSCD
jgi:hypothetical protein